MFAGISKECLLANDIAYIMNNYVENTKGTFPYLNFTFVVVPCFKCPIPVNLDAIIFFSSP